MPWLCQELIYATNTWNMRHVDTEGREGRRERKGGGGGGVPGKAIPRKKGECKLQTALWKILPHNNMQEG